MQKLNFYRYILFFLATKFLLAIVSRQSKSMNESEVGLLIRGRAASSRRN